jgi:pre-mRNA-splicing factor 38B
MAFQMNNTTTYGLEQVLRQNILNSDYYNNTCLELTTWVLERAGLLLLGHRRSSTVTLLGLPHFCRWDEVVDEIYENVAHVEPWMSGGARGPSTAFCLLHRLFTLNLQVRDVRALIDHKDSPYIRAVSADFLLLPSGPWKHVKLRHHMFCAGGLPVPTLCGGPQGAVEVGGCICE